MFRFLLFLLSNCPLIEENLVTILISYRLSTVGGIWNIKFVEMSKYFLLLHTSYKFPIVFSEIILIFSRVKYFTSDDMAFSYISLVMMYKFCIDTTVKLHIRSIKMEITMVSFDVM